MRFWRTAMTRVIVRYRRGAPPGDGLSLDSLHDPGFVAIDVETTGLDPRRDALVAVAAIPFVGGQAQTGFVSLVRPGRPIPPAATAVHGIRDQDVIDAPAVDRILPRVEAACAGRVIAGHDIDFDLTVLRTAHAAQGLAPWQAIALCTRRLARAAIPGIRDTSLEVVAARLGVSTAGRHTADGDARMAGAILIALLPALHSLGARTVGDLLRLVRTAPAYD
jgi:DNA polymerase III epsilon subunit-like protein